MTALTNAEKQKAHRRRMAEKMARYEGALKRFEIAYCEVVETANKQHRENIITYAELKTAVNTAGYLRGAIHNADDE